MSWSFGVEDRILDITHNFGQRETFPEAMRALHKEAINRLNDEIPSHALLIADISDIASDPGIMDDPDQWEEEEFNGPNEYVWYVTED